MSDVYRLIVTTLTEHFGLLENEIHPDASLEDLGMDSLSLAELAIMLKDETGIELEDQIGAASTLAQTATLLEAELEQAGRTATLKGVTP